MHASVTPSRLMVLMFTDVVGSTELKTRLGTNVFARLISRHDQLFKQIVAAMPGAAILKDTGDGFFATFATMSDAVRAALQFQWAMATEPWQPQPLRTRIGLHLGEVAELELESTGMPKVVGLAPDLTARVMGLASGGQILMTRSAFNDARQFVDEHPAPPRGTAPDLAAAGGQPPVLQWVAHGPYLLKGSDDEIEVFEVGAAGLAPLSPPRDNEKARRVVAAHEEETLGWRPAVGLEVPGRKSWVLQRKLGDGGFGEVWLGAHCKTGQERVYKFCFDAERLRSFKRELTLFRLLRTALGDRPDIARIFEVKLDASPFFLESEFSPFGDLANWASARRGIDAVPLATRLDLVARTADAVAAAHSVGILHKDIKPSNILIREEDGAPRPLLSDFGIGMITNRGALEGKNITVAGFTHVTENSSSRTGTRMYSPPELDAGKPFSTQGDVFALGVLLYQMVVGDLLKPLAEGWERDIEDEYLRQDIAECVDGDPARRLGNAAELRRRLRSLGERRDEGRRAADARKRLARRRRLTRLGAAAAGVLLVVLSLLAVGLLRERRLKLLARQEAERVKALNEFYAGLITSSDPRQRKGRNYTVREWLDEASAHVDNRFAKSPDQRQFLHTNIGRTYMWLGMHAAGERHLRQALTMHEALGTAETAEAAELCGLLAYLLRDRGYDADQQEALKLFERSFRIYRKVKGDNDTDTIHAKGDWDAALGKLDPEGDPEAFFEGLSRLTKGRRTSAHVRANLEAVVALARQQWRAGDVAGASTAIRRHADEYVALGPEIKEWVAMAIAIFAGRQHFAGDNDAALPLMKGALDMSLEWRGPGHPETAIIKNHLATLLRDVSGDLEQAEKLQWEARTTAVDVAGEEHPETLYITSHLARTLHRRGKTEEALGLARRARELAKAGEDWRVAMIVGWGLADILVASRQFEEAEQVALDLHRRLLPMTERERPVAVEASAALLVRLYDQWGRPESADPYRPLATTRPATRPAPGPASQPAVAGS